MLDIINVAQIAGPTHDGCNPTSLWRDSRTEICNLHRCDAVLYICSPDGNLKHNMYHISTKGSFALLYKSLILSNQWGEYILSLFKQTGAPNPDVQRCRLEGLV